MARLALIVVACLGMGILVAASGADARHVRPVRAGSRYLALGDSVTFGYQESKVQPPPNYFKASSFKGYPEHLGAAMHLRVTDAACPGETTASLIDPNAPSNGCENTDPSPAGYRNSYPLHVRYRGSQLSFAIRFLKRHRGTRLVSLMIGANDLFRCQRTTSDACLSKSEQAATLATIKHNVHHILRAIRKKAHYRGQLVLVHYYSLDYKSALITGVVRALNSTDDAAGKGLHVAHADGFGEYRRATAHSDGNACTAGFINQLSTGGCGVHPSFAGQGLLAVAVEGAIRR